VDEQLSLGLRGIVSGRVQGVGFRAFIKREALNRGLRGRAVNLHDGRVEVILWGDRETLAELQTIIAQGPESARVSNLTWEPYVEEAFEGFDIG
jgi:acylphosphatase